VFQQVEAGLGRVPPPGYAVSILWLNNTSRGDFVSSDIDDHSPDAVSGCATLYLYYLHDQLRFGIHQIIEAGASTLEGVYQNLTGARDGWTPFISLVNSHYPPGPIYNPLGDSVFPVSDLSDFWAPNEITCGYGDSSPLFVDNPAQAEVIVALASADPSIVNVPSTVTVPVGATTASVPIQAAALPIPFTPPKAVQITATYAGKSRSITVDVVPPTVASITLSPDAVNTGQTSTATVTLDRASRNGPVDVDLTTGAPGWVTMPNQLTIPEGQDSGAFTILTRSFLIPFPTAHADILASYAGTSVSATLTISPTVVVGIIQSLTLFPATVVGGNPSEGIVTLEQAVSTPTVVGLAVIPFGQLFPAPGQDSDVASVPSQIVIPAGQLSGTFPITTTQLYPPVDRKGVSIMAAAVVEKYAMLTVTG
jgi:hypothetical protein